MKHVATILLERDGVVSSQTREFGGFKRDMRALVGWLQEHRIQQVVMESTGVYWKRSYAGAAGVVIPSRSETHHQRLGVTDRSPYGMQPASRTS
jgi:hypothetical protein